MTGIKAVIEFKPELICAWTCRIEFPPPYEDDDPIFTYTAFRTVGAALDWLRERVPNLVRGDNEWVEL